MQTGMLTMIVASLDLITFLTDVSILCIFGVTAYTNCPCSIFHRGVSEIQPKGTYVSTSVITSRCVLTALCSHLIFNFPLAKLYTNSLMSSLNSRKGWNFSVKNQSGIDTETGQLQTSGTVKPNLSIAAIKSVCQSCRCDDIRILPSCYRLEAFRLESTPDQKFTSTSSRMNFAMFPTGNGLLGRISPLLVHIRLTIVLLKHPTRARTRREGGITRTMRRRSK